MRRCRQGGSGTGRSSGVFGDAAPAAAPLRVLDRCRGLTETVIAPAGTRTGVVACAGRVGAVGAERRSGILVRLDAESAGDVAALLRAVSPCTG